VLLSLRDVEKYIFRIFPILIFLFVLFFTLMLPHNTVIQKPLSLMGPLGLMAGAGHVC
jgi:hypothetical protein